MSVLLNNLGDKGVRIRQKLGGRDDCQLCPSERRRGLGSQVERGTYQLRVVIPPNHSMCKVCVLRRQTNKTSPAYFLFEKPSRSLQLVLSRRL